MYYKCYDMRCIFHAFIVFNALNSICVLGHKSRLLKMPYILNKWDITRQQRIQEQSICILIYNMLYYSSTFMYQEIITKSFARLSSNHFIQIIIYGGAT